jgi:hypothetical protein
MSRCVEIPYAMLEALCEAQSSGPHNPFEKKRKLVGKPSSSVSNFTSNSGLELIATHVTVHLE